MGPAWIALAHLFASGGDHDQGVAAYVTAAKRYSPGALEPLLFLAIEYLRVRQPALAAAYLLEAYARAPGDARVINELACLQVAKGSYSSAASILARGKGSSLTIAINSVIIGLKLLVSEGSEDDILVKLQEYYNSLEPYIEECKGAITSQSSSTLFPWTNAHPSAHFQCLQLAAALSEWLGEKEEAIQLLSLLVECRNEHRNQALESLLLERLNRLLGRERAVVINNEKKTSIDVKSQTARTPLIKSFSAGMMSNSKHGNTCLLMFLGSPSFANSASGSFLGVSGGGLSPANSTSSSSLAASISRRRLSLRRQMTGLRFDPGIDGSFVSDSGSATGMTLFDSSMELE